MTNFIKQFHILMVLVLSIGLFGCSGGTEQERHIAYIERAMENVEKLINSKDQLYLLRIIYDKAMSLKDTWPDSIETESFLAENEEALKDLDAYKWAVERGAPVDLTYEGLKKYWKYGRDWRVFIADRHPQEALPVMMVCAVNEHNALFFDQYAEAFRQSGNRIHQMAEVAAFNSACCRFIAEQLGNASKKGDKERITFLLKYMPRLADVILINQTTRDLMRDLSVYVCNELRDEEMACRLIELGYGFKPVDLEKAGFGDRFIETLKQNPEFSITEVLQLDKWHGHLSEMEKEFILALEDEYLDLVIYQYIDEALEWGLKRGLTDEVFRLMAVRSNQRPYRPFEYEKLFEQAITHDIPELFEHILGQCPKIRIENIDLVTLSGNYDLFVQYAPQIFSKVYPTMDRSPRSDGTTLGRVVDVLASQNHKAGLWILENVKLPDIGKQVNEGRTLLMHVCEKGNLEMARVLVEQFGADVSAETGYMELKLSILGQSKSKEGRLTPLFFAAVGGNGELIRYLVLKGANVNARSAYGATPLMYAVTHNQPEAVRTLIDLQANVHVRMNSAASRTADFGQSFSDMATAYNRAKFNKNDEIMQLLISAGVRP